VKVHPDTDRASASDSAAESAEQPGTESSAGSPATTTRTGTAATTATEDTTPRLGARGWAAAIRRSAREFADDGLQDRAAALTYYGIQSIFPGLLVLVSLLGLLGVSATQRLITNLANGTPASVRHVVKGALIHLQHHHATAGILALAGIVLGLWSASRYVAAFMRASNVIYDVPEGRPFWKTTPIRLAVTLAMLVLLVASALIVVVTGGLASRVGHALGIGSAAVTAWDIAKWPVLLVIVSIMFAILYWASPNARHGFRWLTAGSVLAVAAWLICSGLFAVYLAFFGNYDKVYGSLGGVIIFLVWMWISNVAILMGAELDAELERGRAIAGGHPPDKEPFARLRDTRRLRKRLKSRRTARPPIPAKE
jgi:membrane protein